MSTESTQQLVNIFRTAGKEYGFDDVVAEYSSFKEFKVRWQRSKGRANFKVSDYMEDAPAEIIDGIARALFSKISGSDTGYPEEVHEWLATDKFVKANQPTYLRRNRSLTRSAQGETRNLKDSYHRLVNQGLIESDEDVCLTWTTEQNIRRVGYCSVLMKVIAISSVFDTEMIPEFVLDYVVYHEFLHIQAGFDPFGRKHTEDFVSQEKKFPKIEEAEDWIKKLCLYK